LLQVFAAGFFAAGFSTAFLAGAFLAATFLAGVFLAIISWTSTNVNFVASTSLESSILFFP
jgi:hypothetical protein